MCSDAPFAPWVEAARKNDGEGVFQMTTEAESLVTRTPPREIRNTKRTREQAMDGSAHGARRALRMSLNAPIAPWAVAKTFVTRTFGGIRPRDFSCTFRDGLS